jgi:transcriptional regulator GlxA family with amidase domain
MTSYGIVAFDLFEELDLAGPYEVFAASRDIRAAGDTVAVLSDRLEPIRGAKGLRVLPDATLAETPHVDVVLVPGGDGTERDAENADLLAWVRQAAGTATWLTSVCTGSLILHAAGVADGRPLATHWSFEDALEARGAVVERRARFVRAGSVVSSQGVSAGIDMALWLVGQLHGVDHARDVQRYIQYDPAPPYTADV